MIDDEILEVEITSLEDPAPEQSTGTDPEAPEEITGDAAAPEEEQLQQIQVEVSFPERPFMTTPIDEYTVSEGLMLLIWLTLIVLAVLNAVRRFWSWLW